MSGDFERSVDFQHKETEYQEEIAKLKHELSQKDTKIGALRLSLQQVEKQFTDLQATVVELQDKQNANKAAAGSNSVIQINNCDRDPQPQILVTPVQRPSGSPTHYAQLEPDAETLIDCPMGCGYWGLLDDIQVHMLEAHEDVMAGTPATAHQETASTSGHKVEITFVLPDNTKQTSALARDAPLAELHRKVQAITQRPPGRVMMLAGGKQLKNDVDSHAPWVNTLSDAMQKEDVVSIICIPRRN